LLFVVVVVEFDLHQHFSNFFFDLLTNNFLPHTSIDLSSA
jgi:hypothetical protein